MALDDYIASEIVLDCAEGVFGRREALRRLMLLGITAPAAAAMLAACGSDGNGAEQATSVAATNKSASTAPATAAPATASPATTAPAPATTAATGSQAASQEIRFAGPQTELIGVLATPSVAKGAVLVIHENRGLTAHIRSIPGRLAADGYTALAIDLLSEEGGSASLPSEGDATAALGRALLAAGEPRLSAAVPFYGPAPSNPDFSGSPNAAVLGIYAELDSRVDATQQTARAALEAAGLTFEIKVFPGVDHAFFNDTGPRYNAEQAALAYQAMLDWFAKHLAV